MRTFEEGKKISGSEFSSFCSLEDSEFIRGRLSSNIGASGGTIEEDDKQESIVVEGPLTNTEGATCCGA